MLLDDEKKFATEFVKSLNDGDILFDDGDESREMYVVVEGEIVVTKKTSHGYVELAILKKGNFVGEMALLESLPRSARAIARGPTRLLALHPGGFLLKVRRDPTFAFEMLQKLSARIRSTNDRLMLAISSGNVKTEQIKEIISATEFSGKKAST